MLIWERNESKASAGPLNQSVQEISHLHSSVTKKHLNPESKSRGKVSGVFAFLRKWWGPFIRAPRWRGETLKMSTHPRTHGTSSSTADGDPTSDASVLRLGAAGMNRQMRISWSCAYRGPRGTKDRTFPKSRGSKLKCPKKALQLEVRRDKILL